MKLIEAIEKIICDGQDVTLKQLKENNRKKEILFARQLMMYFTWINGCGSQEYIGERYGSKDHSTVNHSIKTINNYIETDKKIARLIDDYSDAIKNVIYIVSELEILKRGFDPIRLEANELKDKLLIVQNLSNNIESRLGGYMSKIESTEEKIVSIVKCLNEFCKYNQ